MAFGSGKYQFEVVPGWGRLPDGWEWGWICGVACDSQDRVYVFSRSAHPMVVFDRDGRFIASWGEELFGPENAHGIYIDKQDRIWTTEWLSHCVRCFTTDGELLLTIGTPGTPGAADGDPFNRPTDAAPASNGDLYISDGYVNARVHHYSPDGRLLNSWGSHGSGPGEFDLSHCVRIDRRDRVWVCDRENRRIQVFDLSGNYLFEWSGLKQPDTIHFDPVEDVLYMAELEQQVSVRSLDGEVLAAWGGGEKSEEPGLFAACPHGIWTDSQGSLYVSEVQANGRLQKFVRL